MTGKPKGSRRVRWLWTWIARERGRRGIGRAEFARRIGIRPETLREIEKGRCGGSDTTALLDAFTELGADGAVAEMDGMDPHGAALSLTERERGRYDAIAERDGITRAQAIRQLAAEGLLARVEADGANGKSGLEIEAGRSVFRHRRDGTRARQPRKAGPSLTLPASLPWIRPCGAFLQQPADPHRRDVSVAHLQSAGNPLQDPVGAVQGR